MSDIIEGFIAAVIAVTTLTVAPLASGVDNPRPEGAPTHTPTPTVTPTPTATPEQQVLGWPTHRQLTRSEMVSLARAGGFPEWAVPAALSVAWCESNWTPNAVSPVNRNGTRDYGLWQINSIHHDSTLDPLGNARAAVRIWRERGSTWAAWTCKP